MTSLEHKAAGAEAWGRGDFPLAIDKFSMAIDSELQTQNDMKLLLTLYSNRSAAYMKIGDKRAALLDAEKCVEKDSNWPKGYIRKGDALFSLGRYTEAYNAYNSAQRLDGSDSGVKSKCLLAEKAIRDSASSSSSSSSSSSASSAASSSSSSWMMTSQAYLRLFVLVNALAYLALAFIYPGLGRFCYRNFVIASIVDYLLAVFSSHGFPRLSMEYAQRLMTDPSSMYLFLSLLLLMQRPTFLSMAPLVITALVHSSHYLNSVVTRKSPETLSKVAVLVNKYVPSVLKHSESSWNNMTTSAKWRVFDQELMLAACYCEVLQGLAFIVQLIFPSRNFLGTMMWWQYLQMRYMMDQGNNGEGGNVRAAFKGVDDHIMSILTHKFCPQLLSKGYNYVKVFLANKVKLPEPGEPAPSMSSMISKSCTIM